MKKCTSCGFDNDDDARFCAGCGGPLADAPVASEQAAPVQADDPFAEPAAAPAYEQPQDQQPQEAKQKKGFKGTVVSVKDKTVGFEKKHSIILNAIVMICALVVIFVALFAPIKIVNYQLILPQTCGVIESYTEADLDKEKKGEQTAHYVEISQSIWQIIGASSYFGADDKKLDELEEQIEKAELAAEEELAEWELKNLDLALAVAKGDVDAKIKYQNKMAEVYADHLSDVNVLGYALATGFTLLDSAANDFNSSEDFESAVGVISDSLRATVNLLQAGDTLGFAAVIVILAIVSAIVSLVYLIKAIIGMVKKQPQNKLFKYFGTILGLSGAMLILSMVGPLLAPGGGALAIAVFISIMYFLCGVVNAFVFSKDGLLLAIKNTAVALVAMIAFFILCSNIFAVSTGNAYANTTVNAPMGYGIGYFFTEFIPSLDISHPTEAQAYQFVGSAVNGITGFVTFLLMIFTVSFLLCAYKRTLKRLAFGNISKSSCSALAITGAIFAIISIVVSMILPGMFLETFGEAIGGELDLDLNEIVTGFTLRAQVWVSLIFFLVCAIFNIVFNPKSKNPDANVGQQA